MGNRRKKETNSPIQFHSQCLETPLYSLKILILHIHHLPHRPPKPNLQQNNTQTIDVMRSGVPNSAVEALVRVLIVVKFDVHGTFADWVGANYRSFVSPVDYSRFVRWVVRIPVMDHIVHTRVAHSND
jgi:hypothetical protein